MSAVRAAHLLGTV